MIQLLLGAILMLTGCVSHQLLKDPPAFSSNSCQIHFRDSENQDTDRQLDHVSELFRVGCFHEVIQLATFIREQRRDKFYSVSAEMAEILTPEGTFLP